jgi:uncharacterized protein (DUF58 family)
MTPQELLRKVRRIQVITNRLVDELLAGEYHSAFKGRGMEFDEVRVYQAGDDIRAIDWNVTARTGVPHIKNFCEERELTIIFLVDLSNSLMFGTELRTKNELAVELAAVLAFAAIKNNDKVGLILFSDRIEKFVPPRKGRGAVLRIIRELLSAKAQGQGTDLALALDFLGRVQRKKAVVFLFSDFMCQGYEKSLKRTESRHDTIAVTIGDRREEAWPSLGLIEVEDAETGEARLFDSSDPHFRQQFNSNRQLWQQARQTLLRQIGMDELSVYTGRSYLKDLHRLFRQRSQRMRR